MTMQETRPQTVGSSEKTTTAGRGPLAFVLVAVVALLLGVLGGWLLRGSDSDPDAVVAGGGDLSERQEEMLDMFADYTEAVLANDGAAVVDMFVPYGTWSGDVGEPLYVEDGSLEEFVNSFSFTAPLFLAPILVDGERLLYVHDYTGASYYDVVTFTATGDLAIVDHRIMN